MMQEASTELEEEQFWDEEEDLDDFDQGNDEKVKTCPQLIFKVTDVTGRPKTVEAKIDSEHCQSQASFINEIEQSNQKRTSTISKLR